MTDYRFVTSIFGEKHLGMLLVNLYSIKKNATSTPVSVFWQEIDSDAIDDLKKAFPDVDFCKTDFDISSSKIKRISSKTLVWEHASKNIKNQNLCFFDVDMFVLKDIGHFFDKDFDVLFTDKNKELFPLNTGVILSKGENIRFFFSKWLEETLKIINSKELLKKAMSTDYPFGGADQMAFYNLVNYDRNKKEYEITLKDKKIKALAVPCSILNETRSVEISENMHIIHYKGGWQMMLLEARGFTKNRTKKDSWPMYVMYLKSYIEAITYLNSSTGKNYTIKSFNIHIPFYLDKKTLKENKFLYSIFVFVSFLKQIWDVIVFRVKS